eukprot:TRINITY_DN1165_c0_g2_i2.p2 TRINITY_DN1165_c0_g2~~TRINITY_DN1165_c0_g2_i2.p2  ORF type:complete len:349 (-),score=77.58 TRINITY_DN1165_c0_g2_i2:1187-2233(-)
MATEFFKSFASALAPLLVMPTEVRHSPKLRIFVFISKASHRAITPSSPSGINAEYGAETTQQHNAREREREERRARERGERETRERRERRDTRDERREREREMESTSSADESNKRPHNTSSGNAQRSIVTVNSGAELLRCFKAKQDFQFGPEITDLSMISQSVYFNDQRMVLLADAVRRASHLLRLDLGMNSKITSVGARTLAAGLKENTSLRELVLEENAIRSEGAAAIIEAIQHHKNLLSVNLSSCKIEDDGICKIAELMKSNTSLQYLHLNRNRFRLKGVTAIADMLKHNDSLYVLLLNANEIVEEGVKALSEALTHNKKLEELELSNGDGDIRTHCCEFRSWNH